jgi:hypothetical protein
MWNLLMWLRVSFSDGIVWKWLLTFGFLKRRSISWLAEWVLVFRSLCSVKLLCSQLLNISVVSRVVRYAELLSSNNFDYEYVRPCSPVKVHWCFEAMYCLHVQGRRLYQARNQHEADGLSNFLLPLFSDPEYGGGRDLRHVRGIYLAALRYIQKERTLWLVT